MDRDDVMQQYAKEALKHEGLTPEEVHTVKITVDYAKGSLTSDFDAVSAITDLIIDANHKKIRTLYNGELAVIFMASTATAAQLRELTIKPLSDGITVSSIEELDVKFYAQPYAIFSAAPKQG